MLNAIQIALSGLMASSRKTETVASNIANMSTTGSLNDPDNAPYQAQTTQQTTTGAGVRAKAVSKNPPFVPAYDPSSPFANADGLIGVPNVDLAEEAVNLTMAKIGFKANLKIIEAASEMSEELLKSFDKKV
jgi:flagellar basal-body rod protein FlgC